MSDPTTSDITTTNAPSPPPEIHKIHTREHPLTPQQRLAIHLLLQGQTDQQVADAVRLERSSITRWRLYHPTFRAELNRQREALWLNHADRIRAIAATALNVLQNHLSSTSERSAFRAAISILRLAAKIAPPIGPTDEFDLRHASPPRLLRHRLRRRARCRSTHLVRHRRSRPPLGRRGLQLPQMATHRPRSHPDSRRHRQR